jgi:DNA polymerase bacteriophage-type
MKLYLDFETRSILDVKKVGAWAYASHPSTDITCMGFARDDGPIHLRRRETLSNYADYFHEGSLITAHSVQFEYAIWHFILHKRYGWPERLDPKLWDCTLARSLMCGLPASLEGCALALNANHKKDINGRQAMHETCKPEGFTSEGTPIWNENPDVLGRLYRYNENDIETERSIDKILPPLPVVERKIFELDLLMNRRGIAIDVQSCRAAVEIATKETDLLNAKLRQLTNGAVDSASRIQKMKRWIVTQGVKLPVKPNKKGELNEDKETLDKEAINKLLTVPSIPKFVMDVIKIRQEVAKSSVAKFTAMLQHACEDGRTRGTFQYYGAHTGRWAGRGIQPQNYPQGLDARDQETAIELLSDPTFFSHVFDGTTMYTLSGILRGMLIADKGKTLIGADYNAIEARIVFWLADEIGALSMYARKESPYLEMGKLIFNKIISKENAKEYALAKMTVLGAGFGMGWKRFQVQAINRGVEISDELAQHAIQTYRRHYMNVPKLWYEMQKAAIQAVLNPSGLFKCSKVTWTKDGDFLYCLLPSGRALRYFRPKIKIEDGLYEEQQVLRYWTSADEGAIKKECNGMLGQYRTWGGELVENVVQALARDIMANGMLKVENKGYPLVLTVHDELVAEVQTEKAGSIDDFTALMCETPIWAKTCPIAAEGWIGKRYRK